MIRVRVGAPGGSVSEWAHDPGLGRGSLVDPGKGSGMIVGRCAAKPDSWTNRFGRPRDKRANRY